ncbi:MAG: hypothetical protein KKA05_00935 [Alphaproteobacteria bacterium]|nr:hypothetical protein [Alphaproteobacteria bacterium]MBU0858320.1 hypothetical protein [Alphaproteobacteria bacterium]
MKKLLSLLISLIFFVWLVCNLIDRPLSADAASFLTATAPPAAVEQNAVPALPALIATVENINEDDILECWLNDEAAHEGYAPCLDSATLNARLQSLSRPLTAYQAWLSHSRFSDTQGFLDFRGYILLRLSKYYNARNVLLVQQAQSEQAIQYWMAERQLINKGLQDEASSTMRLILLSLSSYNLQSLEKMLRTDPAIAKTHGAMLNALLSDDGSARHEEIIKAVYRVEYKIIEDFIKNKATWRTVLFYKSNHTANVMADYYGTIIDAAQAGPQKLGESLITLKSEYKALLPDLSSPAYALDLYSYNAVGKLLLGSALIGPESSLLPLFWRQQAHRRALMTLIEAHAQDIDAAEMPKFLQDVSARYPNPFNGASFAWDAAKGTIGYSVPDAYAPNDKVDYTLRYP